MLPEKEKGLLAELFMGSFGNPMSNNRMAKCEVLYQLAQKAWGGAIVEFGAYHGCGAVSLAYGSRDGNGCPVYTIDDYPEERFGWAGERYCAEDEEIFHANMDRAGVRVCLMKETVEDALALWSDPISLIFWDTATVDMLEDFCAWSQFMIPGALFIIHDTGDKRFGSPKVIQTALEEGWELGPAFQGAYIVTIRKPGRNA